MDNTEHLISLLGAIPGLRVFDGDIPPEATGAYVRVTGGQSNPVQRSLNGLARLTHTVWQVQAISNTPDGCRLIVGLVVDALDGRLLGGGLLRCAAPYPPLEDRDDPSEWRWSCLVDVTTYQPRSTT